MSIAGLWQAVLQELNPGSTPDWGHCFFANTRLQNWEVFYSLRCWKMYLSIYLGIFSYSTFWPYSFFFLEIYHIQIYRYTSLQWLFLPEKKKKSNIYFSFELHLKANNFFPQLLIINKRKLNLGSYYLCCFYFIPPDYPSKYLHSKH